MSQPVTERREQTIRRITAMKKRMILERPTELLPERALLVTAAYEEHAAEPPVMQRAYALQKVLAEMTLFMDDDELFVGHPSPRPRSPIVCPELGACWILDDLDSFATRSADAIGLTEENKFVLRDCLTKWRRSSLDAVVDRLLSEEVKNALDEGMITVGGRGTAQGNISINYRKLLAKGLRGIIGEIDEKLRTDMPRDIEGTKKRTFWKAARISCEAVIAFAHRYADLTARKAEETDDARRKAELLEMSATLRRVPEFPAATFREALQSLWLVYTVLHIEADPHAILLGRFDQYMYPFYARDKAEGRISDEDVLELLASLWIKCTAIIKLMDSVTTRTFAGFPLFQNVTIGGQGSHGEDASNDLSRLILDAAVQARVTQPSIGFRYHNKIDPDMLYKVAETIREGLGYPAVMNDNCIIPKHLIRGATLEEARNYCTNCVETDIEGMTDSRAHSGYVNFPKCLLLAMNDGVDPDTGRRIGPRTGRLETFSSFDKLFAAYETQVAHFTRLIVDAYDLIDGAHAVHAPEPFMSSLLDDCIERGMTRQEGGVRYNFSGIFGVGLASVADAMAAVRKLCFDDRSVAPSAMMEALKNNFQNAKTLRNSCEEAPKFGNDDDYVDLIARDAAHIFCREVTQYPCMRGGFYIPELHSVSTHVYFGEVTGATPDGRLKGIAFSDGASPVGGRDRQGPTAAVRSMTKIDHQEVLQGVLYNQKFSRTLLKGPGEVAAFTDYIRTYCDLGGHHIQFNMISTEELRKAQENPSAYRDLIVRVAGYSAYFTELNRNTQDEIIARTEYEELS
ncbi:MAG: formate C-acetyltransferase/glycerol dehydratase family glycyl radical enzyme [Synergistales bacterium]|nr:formate C-acetyltransferase/glycerol dehydratase family glycyl radical enzyme [Synergistales bacterium]